MISQTPTGRFGSTAAATIAVLLALGTLASGANGSIRGRVQIREDLSRPGRRPAVAQLGMPTPPPPQDRRPSVVYLEWGPRAAFDRRENARATMDQRNETFVPRILAVMAGTTVDFPNSDDIYHNVFSLSKPQPFDLGRYAAGRSKSIRFDRPGIVRVFCDIHSHMSAYILVFAHPYFTVTDAEGRFRLEDVPPGKYTVTVWHDIFARTSLQVSIPETGGDVEVNIALGGDAPGGG